MDELLTEPLFYLMPAPFAVLMGIFAGRGTIKWYFAAALAAAAGWFHGQMRFEDHNLAMLSGLIGFAWTVAAFMLYPLFRRRRDGEDAEPDAPSAQPVVFPKRPRPPAPPNDKTSDGHGG